MDAFLNFQVSTADTKTKPNKNDKNKTQIKMIKQTPIKMIKTKPQ